MKRCKRAWIPAAVAMVLLSGCPPDVPPGGADAGDACSDEGRFECLSYARHCCHGVWIEYYDGPCQPRPDAGPPDCVAAPTTAGCPCALTDVAPECSPFARKLECVGGVWTSSPFYACCR